MNENSAVEMRRRKPDDDNTLEISDDDNLSEKPLEIIPKEIEDQQIERIRNITEFANREKKNGRLLDNAYSLDEKYDLRNIKEILPKTYRINNILNIKSIKYFIIVSLFYHIFLYTYLAITKLGGALYTGIMFSIMYSGALMAYWIIYRQNSTLLNWTNIFSSEMVKTCANNVQERKEDFIDQKEHNLMIKESNNEREDYNEFDDSSESSESEESEQNLIFNFDDTDDEFKKYINGYKLYYNPITQFQFMNENMRYLYTCKNSQISFYKYCNNWEEIYSLFIYFIWNIFPFILTIIKIIPDDIIYLGKSFDDEPMGLWGYYNLSGQIIASVGIITASIIMLTSFYQLKCMILGYVEKIREYKDPDFKIKNKHLLPFNRFLKKSIKYRRKKEFPKDDNDVELINYKFKQTREEYLYLQSCCITLSDLWSTPIAVIIFFCTEVIISNVYVINYQLTRCSFHNKNADAKNDYCDFFVGFSFIWLFAALAYIGVLLHSISSINTASAKIKNAFIYSNEGLSDNESENKQVNSDFHKIGGRSNWISYIESNPLNFSIFGITITSRFAVNTTYAGISTLGTFLFSYVFTDDKE